MKRLSSWGWILVVVLLAAAPLGLRYLDRWAADACTREGRALVNRKDYPRAIEQFDRALQIDPKYAPAYHGRGVAGRPARGGRGRPRPADRRRLAVHRPGRGARDQSGRPGRARVGGGSVPVARAGGTAGPAGRPGRGRGRPPGPARGRGGRATG